MIRVSSHTDREWNERRVALNIVIGVKPTVRVEGERIFPYGRINVTLVEVGEDRSALWQIVPPECNRLADDVR